jgi:hypothetical protein
MRVLKDCALLVLGAVLSATAASAAPPGDPSSKSLEGDWEKVMASPKRPWIFLERLKAAGAGWIGTMSIRGLPDFPLRDIRSESTLVHSQFPPELGSLVFDGTLADGEIVGHVLEGEQKTPTRLTRVVPLPAPANRLEAWQQLRQAIAQLKLDLPRKNDAEILVALSHAVALGDNAHTRLGLDPTTHGSFSTTFPIRMWWFSDGPYVIKDGAPIPAGLELPDDRHRRPRAVRGQGQGGGIVRRQRLLGRLPEPDLPDEP